jgi:uncharacterized protein (DUF2141 family)
MLLYEQVKKFGGYILAPMLIASCAQITSPTGGERDTTPPKIISETPPNAKTNFNSKNIGIVFDEFVQVQNAQNIVISPAIEPPPEISARKKELSIKFKKALEPNTTYSIFFGSNVGDNNENNKLDNYSYVFSTGDYLDSLSVSGRVQAADGNIPDNSFLLLYKDLDDSAFLKKRPFYLTKIEKDGSVQLKHIKAGNYKIYALTDKNLNYYYDLPNELIGFTDSAVYIGGNLDSLQLPLFLPEETTLRIQEYDKFIRGGMFNFTLNKAISFTEDEITVRTSEDTTLQTAAFLGEDNKHLKVYLTNLPADSAIYTLIIKNNNRLIDSIRVRCESKQFKSTALFFTDSTTLKNLSVLETQPLKIQSTYYSLSAIDTLRVRLLDSSDHPIPYTISRDADLRTYWVTADWTDKMAYRLNFGDSAISDLAGNYIQNQTIRFNGISSKQAGNLELKVELPYTGHQTIILLKDNTGRAILTRVVRDSSVVQINGGLLPAGMYTVEAIDDVNNNGIWNSGNFSTRSLPEKKFISTKPILIKENWDAAETINVDYTLKSLPIDPGKKNLPSNLLNEKSGQQKFPGSIMKD